MGTYDVLIAGGGSAGLAAAVSAARSGAQTLLVERSGCLGGMAPLALVHSVCGLYHLPPTVRPECTNAPGTVEPAWANVGFPREFASRLLAARAAHGPYRMGRVDVLLQHPTAFALTADALCKETPGLQVRLHTELHTVSSDFTAVQLLCRGVVSQIATRALVDCSGDGVAAAMGGAECVQEQSSRLQRPAFIFILQGVHPEAVSDAGRLKLAGQVAAAIRAGTLTTAAFGAAVRGSGRPGEVFVTLDLEAEDYDPLSSASLTRLEIQGRALAFEFADFLRESVAGFEECFIGAFPARIGVRESRRVVGQYQLSTTDVESGARFEDAVAVATWPIELRENARGARLRFPANDRACEIPLRALRARDHDNLFVAGRCISCSHEAQASVRVIGTCLATGEAAGIAAALRARHGHCDVEAVRAEKRRISQ